MKKILILLLLAMTTGIASAEGLKSVDLKANLRSDFGLGVGVTLELPKNFEIAPSFNYYFNSNNTLTLDGDVRYRFALPRNFSIYPLAGILYLHNEDANKIGFNIGGGFNYDINSAWAIGVEVKYQYIDNFDDTYFALGVSYKF